MERKKIEGNKRKVNVNTLLAEVWNIDVFLCVGTFLFFFCKLKKYFKGRKKKVKEKGFYFMISNMCVI